MGIQNRKGRRTMPSQLPTVQEEPRVMNRIGSLQELVSPPKEPLSPEEMAAVEEELHTLHGIDLKSELASMKALEAQLAGKDIGEKKEIVGGTKGNPMGGFRQSLESVKSLPREERRKALVRIFDHFLALPSVVKYAEREQEALAQLWPLPNLTTEQWDKLINWTPATGRVVTPLTPVRDPIFAKKEDRGEIEL
jgi:hypothetical protein